MALHFSKQEFNSNELLMIVKKTLQDSTFSKKINEYIKVNQKGNKSENIIFKNLRMTCIEGTI